MCLPDQWRLKTKKQKNKTKKGIRKEKQTKTEVKTAAAGVSGATPYSAKIPAFRGPRALDQLREWTSGHCILKLVERTPATQQDRPVPWRGHFQVRIAWQHIALQLTWKRGQQTYGQFQCEREPWIKTGLLLF